MAIIKNKDFSDFGPITEFIPSNAEQVNDKITNYITTNKSDRNVNVQFDQKQFNAQFEERVKQIEEENKLDDSQDMIKPDEISNKLLPHHKPVQDIIINIREMFYKLLEMLIDKQNPIPYLISTPDRQFSLSIFLIVIGTLLLLFSNLMISSDKLN